MLSAIREFFDRHVDPPSPEREQHAIQLATAALLVEVARIDSESTEAEGAAVMRAVRERFGLEAAEAATLIELAEAEMRQAGDYFQFTSLVNRHFSASQKLAIIEMMWRIAYADAVLSAHENHLMRKIGDLLHIPHGDFIAAKMRAQQSQQG